MKDRIELKGTELRQFYALVWSILLLVVGVRVLDQLAPNLPQPQKDLYCGGYLMILSAFFYWVGPDRLKDRLRSLPISAGDAVFVITFLRFAVLFCSFLSGGLMVFVRLNPAWTGLQRSFYGNIFMAGIVLLSLAFLASRRMKGNKE